MSASELYNDVLEFNRTLLTAVEAGQGQRVLREKLAEGALMMADQVVVVLGQGEAGAAKRALIEALARSLRMKMLLAKDLGILPENAFKDLGKTLDRISKGVRGG